MTVSSMLPGIGHSPHREAPDATLKIIADFATATLRAVALA